MMENIREQIALLIRMVQEECNKWIARGKDGLERFVDPNDHCEISAHYGATHMAASLIIWGKLNGDKELYEKGVSLLKSIISRWDKDTKLPAYHFDFNNFALSLSSEYVDDETTQMIKSVVLRTTDSNHNTVNWLPMRWLVNKKRYGWSGNSKYLSSVESCKRKILKATNNDGGIEDRLPHGTSFNLQYDVATVAVMQLLKSEGEQIDLSKELGFLLNAVCPDGDINYQGRGINQVFAWGMWVYLLSTAQCEAELQKALAYLEKRLPMMLRQHNIMLNKWKGDEKYLWWDYHYASVYSAHLLLWLVLAWRDFGRYPIQPNTSGNEDSGLHINRNEKFFVSWFDGRREYLAEYGPTIACIWNKKYGTIFKGTFGPWQGAFGGKYTIEDVVIRNFCGLLEVRQNKDWTRNRVYRKLFPHRVVRPTETLSPLFFPISINYHEGACTIEWESSKSVDAVMNIPTPLSELKFCHLYVDEKEVPLHHIGAICNQYSLCNLYQSRALKGRCFKLILSMS